jgi:hypothetical protein
VILLKVEACRFDFEEVFNFTVDFDGEVAKAAFNLLLAGKFGVLVIAKNIRKDVFYNRYGIGL